MAGAAKPEAKAKEGEDNLSMEEILQSIRKIIADDDKEGKNAPVMSSKPEPAKANGKDASPVPGSDVLELTDMIKDDGSVVNIKANPEAAKPAAAPAPAAPAAPPGDVLSSIDQALAEKPAEKPAPAASSAAVPVPEPVTAAGMTAAPAVDALLSAEAAGAAAAAFRKLKTADVEPAAPAVTPAPTFRSGSTVEDLVAEMLKPMMKAWLDANLPGIVEHIVEREVKKLTRG